VSTSGGRNSTSPAGAGPPTSRRRQYDHRVNDDPAIAVCDAIEAFLLERTIGTEGEGRFPLSQGQRRLLFTSIQHLLDGRKPEVVVPLELAGDAWTLLIVDDAAHLHRVNGDIAEIRFLGRLKGEYEENLRFTDDGAEVTSRFMDSRVPGGTVELITSPYPRLAHVGPERRARDEAINGLRKKLREWAASSEIAGGS
jgi:hypothetical protein